MPSNDLTDFSRFPINPGDRQLYPDKDGNTWKYDQQTDSWEFCGPDLNVNLAGPNTPGLLSPEFKLLLDTVAEYPGAFGIIVDRPHTQTIQGDVKFISNSLDFSCLNSRNIPFGFEAGCSEETIVSCSGSETDVTVLPSFQVRLKEDYLNKLCIDLPAPKGATGKQGPDGPQGQNGFGDGPKGATGVPGPNVTDTLEINEVRYVDVPDISNNPIVDLELVDRGNGPFFKAIKSTRNLASNENAKRLVISPIVRTVSYNNDLTDENCNLNGLSDWTLNKIGADPLPNNVYLLRGSDDTTQDATTVSTVSLEEFIQSLVDLYENQIVSLDKQWSILAKKHIEAADAKARGILSALADDLTRCESTLPGLEFGITFNRCSPGTPISPLTLQKAGDDDVGSIQASGKKWDIVL